MQFLLPILTFFIGAGITVVCAVTAPQTFQTVFGIQKTTPQPYVMTMDHSMTGMTQKLEQASSTDFDKTFLSEMIVHHQGALDMAKLAQTKATKEELKQLADEIIDSQSKEIDQMKRWQKQW